VCFASIEVGGTQNENHRRAVFEIHSNSYLYTRSKYHFYLSHFKINFIAFYYLKLSSINLHFGGLNSQGLNSKKL